MEMLRQFWDAALTVERDAPDELRIMRFGASGEIAELFESAGFGEVGETILDVASRYGDFDELWNGFLAGIGPAGAYCVSLSDVSRAAVRQELFRRIGSPTSSFSLSAVARCAWGRAPG